MPCNSTRLSIWSLSTKLDTAINIFEPSEGQSWEIKFCHPPWLKLGILSSKSSTVPSLASIDSPLEEFWWVLHDFTRRQSRIQCLVLPLQCPHPYLLQTSLLCMWINNPIFLPPLHFLPKAFPSPLHPSRLILSSRCPPEWASGGPYPLYIYKLCTYSSSSHGKCSQCPSVHALSTGWRSILQKIGRWGFDKCHLSSSFWSGTWIRICAQQYVSSAASSLQCRLPIGRSVSATEH